MSDEERPEPDRVEGAPHPRHTADLFGHRPAEAAFLEAFTSGRMHHGWLITGPRGVGKATLAWRIARFLLAQPVDQPHRGAGLFDDAAPAAPASLALAADHPVARRVAALSEGRLFLLRRAWDEDRKPPRLKTQIGVDEVRRLKGFFELSAADGGNRVVIVDSADEMTPSAANALLKMLEEPPARSALLLISHQPSGLLPTIRSRCRELRLAALDPAGMAAALSAAGVDAGPQAPELAELAGGSVGEAIRIVNLDGLKLYASVLDLFATLPRMDRGKALALADLAGARGGEARFDLVLRLLDLFLARLARAGAAGPPVAEAGPGEAALLARLSPDPAAGRVWAEAHQVLGARARHGRAVNLDPSALVLDMVLKVEATAAPLAAA